MNPERWAQIEAAFNEAVELAEAERAAFLERIGREDPALRREIERLIAKSNGDVETLRGLVTKQMSLSGQSLGHYAIAELIGAGGMGEVYRARDTKLKRDVAIKVLPDHLLQDPDRVSRFHREAEMLAALNHPGIAAIYGIEEKNGIRCLVLEMVEGNTLQDRLQRGPIPLAESLEIARQIAEALEAAHQKSIVHRDLKPTNIKVTPAGKVKVLDFGLARIFDDSGTAEPLTDLPTAVTETRSGALIGTVAYMSPEQARGQNADRLSDIWAFGAVLYEMITGKQAFSGETFADVAGAIVRVDPDWSALPENTSPAVRTLLRRCLEKNRDRRIHDIADARIEIEEGLKESPERSQSRDASSRSLRLTWIAMAVMAVALVSISVVHFRERPVAEPKEIRLDVVTPETAAPLEFALSPDGQTLVFVASADGPQRLWLRRLDNTDIRVIPETDGADFPFWSPDGRSIGFFAGGKLKRVDHAGGLPQVLASSPLGSGGSWNADGTILFAASVVSPLSRINASSGDPVPLTKLGPNETSHLFPTFLPDGRHFLYFVSGSLEVKGIYLSSLDDSSSVRLTAADTAALYVKPDRIVYVRQNALVVQQLDLTRKELIGSPVTLASPVATRSSYGGFSVSPDGRIAYRASAGRQARHQWMWFDRVGKPLGVVGDDVEQNQSCCAEISPDGRQVAVDRTVQNNRDIWVWDLIRGGWDRFTTDPAVDGYPIWSPDGKQIAFESTRNGPFDIYVKPANRSAEESLVPLESHKSKWPVDWSKSNFLLFNLVDYSAESKTNGDLWALPMTGTDRKPIAVANSSFNESWGQFSPDGRWVAIQTDESQRSEIIVQPFPNPSGKWPVSTAGGSWPRWSSDGKELYFMAPDKKLMAARIRSTGSTFEADAPVALFQTRAVGLSGSFDVSSDGKFLINQTRDEPIVAPSSITLILNWKP